MSLRRAITYKNQNGLPSKFKNEQYNYLGSGSYGSVYAVKPTNIAFKLHKLNDDATLNKCAEWEHECEMQKKAYRECNYILKRYEICVAKPYAFRYVKHESHGLDMLNTAQNATACIFTMDRIVGGPKWNRYLRRPHRISILPPYIFMGMLESGPNRITLEDLQDTHIHGLPNEAHIFCTAGLVGLKVQHDMIRAFETLLDHGIVPRDIEYVMDGRKHTQTLIALLDFNEVKTVEERAAAYGAGYDVQLDAAHVYIDLCGLRAGNSVNPMARYDSPTPQWKFLCNPLVCPGAFLSGWTHRNIAEIILEYAFHRRMRSLIESAGITCWKPLYVSRFPTDSIHQSDIIGMFTEQEYREYRNAQCIFHVPQNSTIQPSECWTYFVTHNPAEAYTYDRFVEFDIQFQHYVLASLTTTQAARGIPFAPCSTESLHDILQDVQKTMQLLYQPEEDWPDMALF